MNDPATCFSEVLVEPVKIINLLDVNSNSTHRLYSHDVTNRQQLQTALDEFTNNRRNGCQIIHICQTNSYQPLQITRQMFNLISETYCISPEISRLQSCFYLRNKDFEETVCVPLTEIDNDNRHEILYSLRYPEYKEDYETWVIRQTGYFHMIDEETSSNLFIVFEPTPDSKLQHEIQAHLKDHASQLSQDFMWLHCVFYQTYFPAWRYYNLSIESRLLPLVGKSFANYIDQALLVGHEHLGTLYKLKNKLHQASSILENSLALFTEMRSLLKLRRQDSQFRVAGDSMAIDSSNRERECSSYLRTTDSMKERVQSNIDFLSTTVMLRDQVVSKEQNQNMIRLNKSAVFITVVTLVYLPSSWLATFFGMNFFDLDSESHRIVASSMIWIYVVSSLVLTGATFLLYYSLLQRDGKLFTQLKPTVGTAQPTSLWSTLKNKFTKRKLSQLKKEGSNV